MLLSLHNQLHHWLCLLAPRAPYWNFFPNKPNQKHFKSLRRDPMSLFIPFSTYLSCLRFFWVKESEISSRTSLSSLSFERRLFLDNERDIGSKCKKKLIWAHLNEYNSSQRSPQRKTKRNKLAPSAYCCCRSHPQSSYTTNRQINLNISYHFIR